MATVAALTDLILVAAMKIAATTCAESIILSANADSIILSVLPAESMILSAPPAYATRKHTGRVHQQCVVP